jgi:hypothetical protein
MQPTPQEIYAAARAMRTRCRFGQAMLVQELGGSITPGSTDPDDWFDFDASRCRVSLLGLTATGDDMPAALDAWLRTAQIRHTFDGTRRATDGRPDCPYHGAGLA